MRRVRFLSQNRPGPQMGMGHYERLLIHHLIAAALPDDWQFDIVFGGRRDRTPRGPAPLESGLRSATYLGFSPERLATVPLSLARLAVRWTQARSQPAIHHSLSLGFPPPAGRPYIFTIHDLPPARFSDEGTLSSWAHRAAMEAAAIITPSQFAKDELVELLNVPSCRVHVVPNGCEHEVFKPSVEPADKSTLARWGIDGPFLLYVGGFTRRKNVTAMLAAWKSLAREYPDWSLAMVGPASQHRRLAGEVNAPRVVIIGYLDRSQLPLLLKSAGALICPSVYEGFGLPPLEAMATGVPVVGVRAGAIPEVVGNAALLVEDGSADKLAEGIKAILDDADLREALRSNGPRQAKRFQWTDHAAQVLEIYNRVLGGSGT